MIKKLGLIAATAVALQLAGVGPAHAGSTVVYNDGGQYFGIVENYARYSLPPGRSSRGWLGLTDVDTITTATNQCGTVSVDYGPRQVLRSNSFGIPSTASVVHVVIGAC